MNVYPIGHRAVSGFLRRECLIEEKIDGTPCIFGLGPKEEGSDELVLQVRGRRLTEEAKQFLQQLEGVLQPGWIYQGEFLAQPKQNVLTYGRTPRNGIVLYDVQTPDRLLNHEEKFCEADRLGLECAPLLYQGSIETPETLTGFLQQESFLGGVIEGVVIKPVRPVLDRRSGAPIYAKFVSQEYVLQREFSQEDDMELGMLRQMQQGGL